MQRRVAWIKPEESKSNRAIGVALDDTACRVLKKQIGNHHRWVFVYRGKLYQSGTTERRNTPRQEDAVLTATHGTESGAGDGLVLMISDFTT